VKTRSWKYPPLSFSPGDLACEIPSGMLFYIMREALCQARAEERGKSRLSFP